MIRHANARPSITASRGARALMGALVNGANDAKWMADGLCLKFDYDLCYPEKKSRIVDAKKVCEQCPVRPKCLDWAIEHDEPEGVWGGMGPAERVREIQRRRTVTT